MSRATLFLKNKSLGFFSMLLVGVTALIVNVAVPANVSADQPNRGPDPSFIQVGPNAPSGWDGLSKATSYVVSRDNGSTNIGTTFIKVYATTPNVSLQLYGKDMCVGNPRFGTSNNFDQVVPPWFPSPPSWVQGRSTTTFQIFKFIGESGVDQEISRIRGNWSQSSNCASAPTTVPLSGAARDPATGLYMYRVRAAVDTSSTAARNFVNLFWLRANVTSGQAYVTQDTRNGNAQNFGYQLSSPIPSRGNNPPANPAPGSSHYVYYRTTLPFGSDCSVGASAEPATISFFDLDSGNSTVQPRLPLEIRLEKSNGSTVTLSRGDGSQGSITAIGGGWYRLNGGNQETINAAFRPEKDAKYRLQLRNVFYNNTMQFRIPYESIFYYRDCQRAQLTGSTSSPTSILVPGQTASWTHTVTNRGPGTASEVIAEIRQRIYDRNGRQLSDDVVDPRLVDNDALDSGQSASRRTTFQATPDDVGKRICQRVTWRSLNAGSGQTTQTCTTVGKQPKLQIWGGDLRTGGNVNTSTSTLDGKIYGSWDEYAAFINGYNQNNAFATAAAIEGGLARGGQVKRLTFANTTDNGAPTSGWGGGYSTTLPNGQAALTSFTDSLGLPNRTGFNGNISSMGQSGVYTTPANTTRTLGGNVGPGKTIVVKAGAGGTIRIDGNITYQGSNLQLDQIPQVIIIADTIRVDSDVTRVDAWLVTDRVITCNGESPSLDRCEKKLEVNGPVAAQDADFKRTAGSDDSNRAGDPAEVINLRADAYLWAYGQASKDVIPTTIKVTNLPPRY